MTWPQVYMYTGIHVYTENVKYNCILLSADITSLRVIGVESLKKKASSCNTGKTSSHELHNYHLHVILGSNGTCTYQISKFFSGMFIKYTKTWFFLSFFYYTRTFEESSGILLLTRSVRPSVRFSLFVSLSANSSYISRRNKSLFWIIIADML